MTTRRFKAGDIVWHKRLKKFGKFVEYNWITDEEAYVEFFEEDGYTECKCITVAQLYSLCKYVREDGICMKGVSSSGRCKFPVCSHFEQR